MKSGNLNFLEPSGPLQACKGPALPIWTTTFPGSLVKCYKYLHIYIYIYIYIYVDLKYSEVLRFRRHWAELSVFHFVTSHPHTMNVECAIFLFCTRNDSKYKLAPFLHWTTRTGAGRLDGVGVWCRGPKRRMWLQNLAPGWRQPTAGPQFRVSVSKTRCNI